MKGRYTLTAIDHLEGQQGYKIYSTVSVAPRKRCVLVNICCGPLCVQFIPIDVSK